MQTALVPWVSLHHYGSSRWSSASEPTSIKVYLISLTFEVQAKQEWFYFIHRDICLIFPSHGSLFNQNFAPYGLTMYVFLYSLSTYWLGNREGKACGYLLFSWFKYNNGPGHKTTRRGIFFYFARLIFCSSKCLNNYNLFWILVDKQVFI